MGMNPRAKGAVGGAASGAGAGAAFGPWGAAIGAVVGGVAGGLLADDSSALAKQEAARNALIFNQAAAAAHDKGEAGASRLRSQGVRAMARAKVALMAQGAAGEGIGDVLRGMSINVETDAETIRNNAAREAWGYRNNATNALYEGEAAVDRISQSQDQAMAGSILGGASSAVQGYALHKKLTE